MSETSSQSKLTTPGFTLAVWVATAILWIAFALAAWAFSMENSILLELLPRAQVIGTSLMFCLLTPFMWWAMGFLRRSVETALDELAPHANTADIARARHRLSHLAPWAWVVIAAFMAFGFSQNRFVVTRILDGEAFVLFDALFVLGNVVLWTTIGALASWRLPVSLALSRIGATLQADIYQVHRFAPLARVSTGDVLIVASCMAFMPLQSLDAGFRAENYLAGFMVGLFMAAAMFLLPLLGARSRIVELKQARVRELAIALEATPRSDLNSLHNLMAHRASIESMHNLPINVQVITRIFAYGVIPPLAWVAAALVENLIDSL